MKHCETCTCHLEPAKEKTITDVIVEVCNHYEIYYTEVIKRCRKQNLLDIRYKIYDLLYSDKSKNYTLKMIGEHFCNKDHATILNGLKNVKKYCEIYPEYKEELKNLHLKIYGSLRYFQH